MVVSSKQNPVSIVPWDVPIASETYHRHEDVNVYEVCY